jgi:hypothetical protein
MPSCSVRECGFLEFSGHYLCGLVRLVLALQDQPHKKLYNSSQVINTRHPDDRLANYANSNL